MEFLTEPLASHHDRAAFSSGVVSLDRYLRDQATQDVRRDVSRCFVLCQDQSARVVGYYTLSAASIDLVALPAESARRLPRYRALPAVLIGRLAVDVSLQGRGVGGLLLVDALRRASYVEAQLGVMAVLVDAENERAALFYEHFEFTRLLDVPSRLFLSMRKVRRLFQ